jgi:hypothetical protein
MKYLTKFFVALLLGVTICFGGFNNYANSSTINSIEPNKISSSSDVHNEIKPNETIEIPMTLTYQRVVAIANKTQCVLRPVGVYNNLSNWPIGDVGPLRAEGQKFVDENFSFASNYQIDCGKDTEKRNVQLSSSVAITGERKINIGVINQDGNQPAKITWDNMKNSDDKSLKNFPFEVHAFIKQKDKSFFWIYEITEQR